MDCSRLKFRPCRDLNGNYVLLHEKNWKVDFTNNEALKKIKLYRKWKFNPSAFRRLSNKVTKPKYGKDTDDENNISKAVFTSLVSHSSSSSNLVKTINDSNMPLTEGRPPSYPISTPRPAGISPLSLLSDESKPISISWDKNAKDSASLDILMGNGSRSSKKWKKFSRQLHSLHKDRGSEIDSLLLAKMTPIIFELKNHSIELASETVPSTQKSQRSVVATAFCDELVRQGMDRKVSEQIVEDLPHLVDDLISEANRMDWANYSGGIPLIECLSSRVPDLLAQSGYAKIIVYLHNVGLTSPLIRRAFSEKEIRFTDIIAKVQLLQSIGVHTKQISKIISSLPPFFSLSVDDFHSSFRFLLSVCVRGVDLGKVIETYPEILNPNVQANIPSYVSYFSSFGISQKDIFRICRLYPKLFGCNLTTNVHPKIVWLQSLGFSAAEISRVVGKCPSLLGCSLEKNLLPSVNFLTKLFSSSALKRMILTHPQILTLKMEGHVTSTIFYFSNELGMSEEEIAKMITRQSSILCSSLSSIKRRIDYLISLGLSSPNIIIIIVKFPSILQYAIETLHPKYEYLVNDMQRSVDEIVKFPHYFGYHLESRIIKRNQIWTESNVKKKLSLVSMLATSEKTFMERIHRWKNNE